jgi:ABC-2 type transport system ATP-binding protein
LSDGISAEVSAGMSAEMSAEASAGIGAAAPVLRCEGLAKRYGSRTAVDGLSFDLPPATFMALLGPNGAGKSTLFQMLTGLFAADAGEARVQGHSIRHAPTQALRAIGVVFQQSSLDLDLSVERNLRFHADLHGLPGARRAARIEATCTQLGISADRSRPVRELSGGTRRKVELARALLHQPALLLMDEPTVGLDPASRRDLVQAVRHELSTRGASVLWATHLVEEADAADRVLVLHQGRRLALGTPAEVGAGLGGGRLEDAFIRSTRGSGPGPASSAKAPTLETSP